MTRIVGETKKKPYLIYAYSDFCFRCLQMERVWNRVVDDLETLGTPLHCTTLGTPLHCTTLGTPLHCTTLGTPLGTPLHCTTLGTPPTTLYNARYATTLYNARYATTLYNETRLSYEWNGCTKLEIFL